MGHFCFHSRKYSKTTQIFKNIKNKKIFKFNLTESTKPNQLPTIILKFTRKLFEITIKSLEIFHYSKTLYIKLKSRSLNSIIDDILFRLKSKHFDFIWQAWNEISRLSSYEIDAVAVCVQTFKNLLNCFSMYIWNICFSNKYI